MDLFDRPVLGDGYLLRVDRSREERPERKKKTGNECPRCGNERKQDGTCDGCGRGAFRVAACTRCKRRTQVNHKAGKDVCADCWDALQTFGVDEE